MAAVTVTVAAGLVRARGLAPGLAVGVGLAAVAIVAALGHVVTDARSLHHEHGLGVSARAGVDHCLAEDGATADIPFIEWVRARLPAGALYRLDEVQPAPDLWCVTLTLLPALLGAPEATGPPSWEVDLGGLSPATAALVARHSPRVRVYAPGMALVRYASP